MTEKILTSGNFCLSGEKMDRDRAPTAEAMPPVRTHMLLSEVEMVAAGASASVVSASGVSASGVSASGLAVSIPGELLMIFWMLAQSGALISADVVALSGNGAALAISL